jgi:hypothetical protein
MTKSSQRDGNNKTTVLFHWRLMVLVSTSWLLHDLFDLKSQPCSFRDRTETESLPQILVLKNVFPKVAP